MSKQKKSFWLMVKPPKTPSQRQQSEESLEFQVHTKSPEHSIIPELETTQEVAELPDTVQDQPNVRFMTDTQVQTDLDMVQLIQTLELELEQREKQSDALIQGFEQALDRQNAHIEQLEQENEQLKLQHPKNMQLTIDNLMFDIQELTEQLQQQRMANENQERDFRLFSRKIQSQQQRIQQLVQENEELKSTLRKFQYEQDHSDSFYKEKLEQAVYDNEALKLYISDLTDKLQALDTRMQSPTKESFQPVQRGLSPTKDGYSNGKSGRQSPTKQQNGVWPDQVPTKWQEQSPAKWAEQRKPVDPLEALPYFEKQEKLNQELNALMDQKSKLVFELSRIPSTGGKNRKRMSELDALLDQVELDIAATRKRMKAFGVM